jgi:hypothetical protein
MNSYDVEAMKTHLALLEARVTKLEVFQFTSTDGSRLADQVRDLKLAVAELQSEPEDTELTPTEEAALAALLETDYEDDSPEAVAFVTGFLTASE